jgi:hypothetical protein
VLRGPSYLPSLDMTAHAFMLVWHLYSGSVTKSLRCRACCTASKASPTFPRLHDGVHMRHTRGHTACQRTPGTGTYKLCPDPTPTRRYPH